MLKLKLGICAKTVETLGVFMTLDLFNSYCHSFRIHSNVAINWEAKLLPEAKETEHYAFFILS